jgi:hypothetical protein
MYILYSQNGYFPFGGVLLPTEANTVVCHLSFEICNHQGRGVKKK